MDLDQSQAARLRQFDESFVRVLNEAISRAPTRIKTSDEVLNDVLRSPSRAQPGHLHEVLNGLADLDKDAFQRATELVCDILTDWNDGIA